VDAETFEFGKKQLQSYVSSLPQGFLIQRHNSTKPTVKGTENGFVFYTDKYKYISANFNLNYDFEDKDPQTCFYQQCEVMVSTLCYLNKRDLNPNEIGFIVNHISSKSNYIFSSEALCNHLIAYKPSNSEIETKFTNFDITEFKNYDTRTQFVNALNTALGLVNIKYNYKNIFDLLQERIRNNDYEFVEKDFLVGHRDKNKLSHCIIFQFNLLVTGRKRTKRYGLKKHPISNIYSLLIKSLSLKQQQQNAFIQKGITKYERELKKFNRLINDRAKAQQLVLILSELLGADLEINIVPNVEDINSLKSELYSTFTKTICNDATIGARDFDLMFIKRSKMKIEPITDIKNIFDADLSNSIFNHIEPEEANALGEVFFNEYMAYNEVVEVSERVKYVHKSREVYRLPEIDFNKKANP
jgi:hypothetical protein